MIVKLIPEELHLILFQRTKEHLAHTLINEHLAHTLISEHFIETLKMEKECHSEWSSRGGPILYIVLNFCCRFFLHLF